jgi:hypothetical protein
MLKLRFTMSSDNIRRELALCKSVGPYSAGTRVEYISQTGSTVQVKVLASRKTRKPGSAKDFVTVKNEHIEVDTESLVLLRAKSRYYE